MTVVRVAGDSTSPIRLRLAQSPAAMKMRLGVVEAVRLRFQSGVPGAPGATGPAGLTGATGPQGAAGTDFPNFETRTTVTAENISASTNYVRTAGYSAAGDGGGALYKRVGSQPAHAGKVQSADGAWWEIAELVLTPEMLGGSVQDAVDVAYELDLGRTVWLAPIIYTLPAALEMQPGVRVLGDDGSTLKRTLTAAGYVVDFAANTAHRATLENLTVDGGGGAATAVDPLFLVHNDGANDIRVVGCTLQNSNGHGFYMYAGLRPRLEGNLITNINLVGIGIQPATQTDTAARIVHNRVEDVGYHPIQIHRSNFNHITNNQITGNFATGSVVDVSGTAVTWVSGTNFTGLRRTYMIYNAGLEAFISVVNSSTSITLTATGGSHNDVPASFGSGDMISLFGSSRNVVANNTLRSGAGGHIVVTDSSTIPGDNNLISGNYSYHAGSSSYSVQPVDPNKTVYNSIIGNYSLNPGQNTTAGAALFNCGIINAEGRWTHAADNAIINNGANTLSYGIVSSGTAANQLVLGDNYVKSPTIAAIHRAVLSITLGAGWGTTASTSNIVQNGKSVKFRITTGGTGIAANPTLVLNTTASPTGTNGPLPIAVMQRTTTGVMYNVRPSSGDYLSYTFDLVGFTPTTGENHDFTVHF